MTARPLRDDDAVTSAPGGRRVSVLLLRHAWAIGRDHWDGADHERPLSGPGRAQAQALPGHLAALDLAPMMLIATPTERSVATLAPLAGATGLEIEQDERFIDARPPLRCDDGWGTAAWLSARAMAGFDEIVRRADAIARSDPETGPDRSGDGLHVPPGAERVVIICSHGEVLPALLAGLGGRDGWQLRLGPELNRKAMPKGGAWLLAQESNEVVVIEPPVIPRTTDPGN